MGIRIEWLGHASFRISNGKTIYIDPWKIPKEIHDADIVLISHNHYDHFSLFDIDRVSRKDTLIFAPKQVIDELGRGNPFYPQDSARGHDTVITAVPAYNKKSPFHPREKNWVGFLITLDGKTIYYTGETDIIPEMKRLPAVDVLIIPVSGIHSMSPKTASKAANLIAPSHAIPCQWGDLLGDEADAKYFCEYVHSGKAHLLQPGEHLILP